MESSLFSSCVFLPLPCLPLHFFLWFPLPSPPPPTLAAASASLQAGIPCGDAHIHKGPLLPSPPTVTPSHMRRGRCPWLWLLPPSSSPPGSFPFGPHSTFLPFLRRRPSLSLLLPTKCLWRHLTERRKNMPATLLSQKSVRYRNFSSYDKIYFSTATKIPTGNRSLKSLCRDGIS